MVGCCSDLRYVRRQTVCKICSVVDLARATSGSAVLPGAGATTTGGVVPANYGVDTHWSGPGGASDVGAVAGPSLEGGDGAGPGVVGEVMDGPKG